MAGIPEALTELIRPARDFFPGVVNSMSDGEALLKAILEQPDDDTPRLVYADWLLENGLGLRADFICRRVREAGVERDIEWVILAEHEP